MEHGEHDLQFFTCAMVHAQVLAALERKEEAVIRIQALIPEIRMACLRDKDTAYYLLRAMYHRFIGEIDPALEMANFLITVAPDSGDAYYMRSLIYDDIHETEKASLAADLHLVLSSTLIALLASFFTFASCVIRFS